MVGLHAFAEQRGVEETRRGVAAVAHALLDQAGFVEQFVAVEHVFLVETLALVAEQGADALGAGEAALQRAGRRHARQKRAGPA